ncbi:MAG: GntR family transcriptional regulator [Blautia sp.]
MALKKNLDIVIFEKFYDEIVCGTWVAGALLNIDEMAEKYDVSRTPVQQALKKMNTLGMVKFSSKGHVYVESFNRKQVEDICDVRLLLELEALRIMYRDQTVLDFERLRRISQECTASNIANNVVQTRRTDLEFHRTLVKQTGNACLYDLFEKVQGQFMVANYLECSHTSLQQKVATDEHDQLLRAIEQKDFQLARSIVSVHIHNACEKIVVRIKD